MAKNFWKVLGIVGGTTAAICGVASLIKGRKTEDDVDVDYDEEEEETEEEADEDSEEE